MRLGDTMKRTTILAEEELLLEAQYLAKQQGKTLTTIVREALAHYVAAQRKPRHFLCDGIGNSGDPDLVHKIDDILRTELDPIEGWSPRHGSEVDQPNRRR